MPKRKPVVTAPAKELAPHVRWMIRRDMPEVLDIEEACFGVEAWNEDKFLEALRQRNCIGMVATENQWGDKAIGFMVYELNKHSLNILDFAVCTKFRRSGVGRVMAERLKNKLSSHRRRIITVKVRETSMGALMFFKSMGFQATRLIRDHFEFEDAIVMRYVLETPEKCSNGTCDCGLKERE